MRVRFSDLFSIEGGAIAPKTAIHINGITMTPGISFGGGVSFGGLDLTQHIGQDVEVERMPDGVYDIKGFYN